MARERGGQPGKLGAVGRASRSAEASGSLISVLMSWGGARHLSRVSSPSVATSGAGRPLATLEGKTGLYFSSLDTTIDILKKRAQELIENINESRQKDHALMTNFRDSLKIKVSDLTEKLEERMYQIYDHHNKVIQEKLQEFTQKMAKISHLETELKQVCQTVETVYKDLCLQPEAVPAEEQSHRDSEC
ncbi:synaptonemal complex central element protein 2 isoform X2 [Oryctolagus cuniculus]|uniref:synaptonemal complex central element protein 2 isoform X2 n=1 Tax=Oryctolagus cuniculus TaxID=9986 RepID=UPI003879645E